MRHGNLVTRCVVNGDTVRLGELLLSEVIRTEKFSVDFPFLWELQYMLEKYSV